MILDNLRGNVSTIKVAQFQTILIKFRMQPECYILNLAAIQSFQVLQIIIFVEAYRLNAF